MILIFYLTVFFSCGVCSGVMAVSFIPDFIGLGSSVVVLGVWDRSIRGFLGVTMVIIGADDVNLPFLIACD